MKNDITKFLAYYGRVQVMVADTTELIKEIKEIHDLTPTTSAALGRIATIVAMMVHLNIKELTDSITVQIKGNGPIGTIIAVGELEDLKKANIRIDAENKKLEIPLKQNGKIDVSGAVGTEGYLNVIKKNDITNKTYNGLIPLVSGEIAEDFTQYFVQSEQKPTALALGVLVDKEGIKKAGGYIINPMPDAREEDVSNIEKSIQKAESISELLKTNFSLKEIAKIVTGDENIEVLEEGLDVQYKCNCNKQRFEKGIISLGKEEISKIIKEDGKLEARCHFCNKIYNFTLEELKELEKKSEINLLKGEAKNDNR